MIAIVAATNLPLWPRCQISHVDRALQFGTTFLLPAAWRGNEYGGFGGQQQIWGGWATNMARVSSLMCWMKFSVLPPGALSYLLPIGSHPLTQRGITSDQLPLAILDKSVCNGDWSSHLEYTRLYTLHDKSKHWSALKTFVLSLIDPFWHDIQKKTGRTAKLSDANEFIYFFNIHHT